MLQWMGGSRRKVSTSRKSTHTRQKQYFEQRKRQKLTFGSENHEDRRHKRLNHHDEPNSLDILSLNNLAAIAEECFHSDKNDNSDFQEKVEASQSLTEFPSNNIMPYNDHSRELSKDSFHSFLNEKFHIFSAETVQEFPKIPIACNYSKKGHENLEESKTSKTSFSGPLQTKISILDLLSDDQSYCRSEGLPSEEQHVAFSVAGESVGFGRISLVLYGFLNTLMFCNAYTGSFWTLLLF
ncbi:unnamed protein product [Spirodela intermedia]|uniref:Uncharacterized protein n=1 Tax=Spirodela intermedia TaxID=51605 RepID=A0A7I8ICM8_SPIIN|nr:unnamed protein product [Spirodela intermedia]CAA6654601.1 unnamed protein product [Spirodela intermedia]